MTPVTRNYLFLSFIVTLYSLTNLPWHKGRRYGQMWQFVLCRELETILKMVPVATAHHTYI
jgi:hypothetical protein